MLKDGPMDHLVDNPCYWMKTSQSISVIFPAFNEEEMIVKTVAVATETLQLLTDDYEIIIVDDGSADDTYRVAMKLSEADTRIKVVRHQGNLGYGAAIRTGLNASTNDITLLSDSDLPFDFHELLRAVRVMEFTGADVVSAFRHKRTREGMLRTMYSLVYNGLIRLLFGLKVKDVNFSFKLLRREVLDTVDLHSTGSFIDAELLIKSKRAGFTIQQIGVDYFPRSRGVSTLSRPFVILHILWEMLLFCLGSWIPVGKIARYARKRTPDKPGIGDIPRRLPGRLDDL